MSKRVLNRQHAKELLLAGEHLQYSSWTFNSGWMTCDNECCSAEFKDIEEALDTIEDYSGWNEVRVS